MDKRKYNGGNKNAGRKSKAEEQNLIEKLTPLEPLAFESLKYALTHKKDWAVKLTFEYLYGKPKQYIEADVKQKIDSNRIDRFLMISDNQIIEDLENNKNK